VPRSSAPIPADTLLLCIDLQSAFLDAIAEGAAVLRRCELAVAAAVGLGLPVAFTEQVPQKLGGTIRRLIDLAPGAPVWGKNAFSALADEGIRDALLHQRRVRHLLLCGIETPICVYQTAADALREQLEVTILSDCVGARRTDDARTCLTALGRHGAHLLPVETVCYSLLRDTHHPFFRALTRLVKAHHAPAAAPTPISDHA
jgi:nicotinamidase-related amidase